MEARDSFPVYALDAHFDGRGRFRDERFALGHFDVEGAETEVLRGARRLLTRAAPSSVVSSPGAALAASRPFFTVEASSNTFEKGAEGMSAVQLLDAEVAALNYTAYLVDESCGGVGCRNFVCVPAGLWGRLSNVSQCRGTEAKAVEDVAH